MPVRLLHDGHITITGVGEQPKRIDFLPGGAEVELLAEYHGLLQGRFVMLPKADYRPPLKDRLLAIALADQVSAALAEQTLYHK